MKNQRRHDKRNQKILLQAQMEAQQALLDFHAMLTRSKGKTAGVFMYDSIPAAIRVNKTTKAAG